MSEVLRGGTSASKLHVGGVWFDEQRVGASLAGLALQA